MENIAKVTLVVVFTTIIGYGVYTSQKIDSSMSELMLANVEALADGEYPASPNPGSDCKGGRTMCYMGQGNVFGKQ